MIFKKNCKDLYSSIAAKFNGHLEGRHKPAVLLN